MVTTQDGQEIIPDKITEVKKPKSFQEALMLKETLSEKTPEELKDYPWDQCIKDQMKRYGSREAAERVCGYIRSKYGG